MLLNLSNHPSDNWSPEQMKTALHHYGSVQDLPFPQIDPKASSDQIAQLAEEFEFKIREINPDVVHIMGEMTFTFQLVNRLKAIGISCVASTTQRIIQQEENQKISIFQFVQFRSY